MAKLSAHGHKVTEWRKSKHTQSENTKDNYVHIALMSDGRILIKETYKLNLYGDRWTSESTGWKLGQKYNNLEETEQKLIKLGYEKI